MSFVSAWRQLLMLIVGYAQEVSSSHKDRRNRTHVDHSLTCCSEENSKVLGYQNVVVDSVRGHPQPERTTRRGTSVLSRADTYIVMHSLKMTRWGTSNQWRSWRRMRLRPLSKHPINSQSCRILSLCDTRRNNKWWPYIGCDVISFHIYDSWFSPLSCG